MDPDEKKHEEEIARRRLTLLPGDATAASPHEPQKLTLVVNADRRLYEAVDLGHLRRAATWLERGANPSVQDPSNGRTALMEAISPFHDPAIAKLLVDKGADVRVSEYREGTFSPPVPRPVDSADTLGGQDGPRSRGKPLQEKDFRATYCLGVHC